MDKKQDKEGVLELEKGHIVTAKLAGFFLFNKQILTSKFF